jgi:NADH-quinone oxidoreductase subunit L
MPITFITYLIGSLALCAFPPFAGFFSKDSIITAAHHVSIPGHGYAYWCVSIGAMVTAFYTFRSLFLTFFGKFRGDNHAWHHVHESPLVVWLPLVVLAIPSVMIGWVLYAPMVAHNPGLLGSSITLINHHFFPSSAFEAIAEGIQELPFWFSLIGAASAWVCYILQPGLPALLLKKLHFIYFILINKLGFDAVNDLVFIKGAKKIGQLLFNFGDIKIIDGGIVNGTANIVSRVAAVSRKMQTGYLFHYITVMVIGLIAFLFLFLLS